MDSRTALPVQEFVFMSSSLRPPLESGLTILAQEEALFDVVDDCWMISKSKNETNFVNSFEEIDKYVYLLFLFTSLINYF